MAAVWAVNSSESGGRVCGPIDDLKDLTKTNHIPKVLYLDGDYDS